MSLTPRAALLAAVAVVVVLLVPADGATVGLTVVAFVLAVVIDVAFAASPRALGLARDGVARTRLGEDAAVSVVVVNPTGRTFRGLVRDAWPPTAGATPRAHRIVVPPGERRRVITTLHPTRRGRRNAAGVTLRAVGPLGVAARQRHRALPGGIQVLPPFTSRRFLPEKLSRLRTLDGAVVAPVRGQGTEFDSLREYVVGDDPRSIDWRATARRRDVVVRTWRPERDRRLLLVLDSGRTAAARVGDATRFDSALDAALLLTAVARQAGDRVAVLAHDRTVRGYVDAARSGATLSTVVNALADVEPTLVETDMRAVVTQALRRLPKRSLVVLFTALDPAPVRAGLLPAIGALVQRHVVVVASVADPGLATLQHGRGSTAAVYGAAAAESADAERRAVAQTLHRAGVVVTQALPDVFAPAVTDTYLELKAAGRL